MLQQLHDLDCKWSLWMHQKGLVIPRSFLRLLEFSGDGLFWIPATAATWFASSVQASKMVQLFVFNLFIGFLFDALLVGTLKLIFRRPRPVYNKGMYLVVSLDHWSFPSGHSSRAIFIATFFWLHLEMWESIVSFKFIGLPVLVFSWALNTAVSRILLGRHYFLDVFVGCMLGLLEAIAVFELLSVPEDVAQSFHQALKYTANQFQACCWNLYGLLSRKLLN